MTCRVGRLYHARSALQALTDSKIVSPNFFMTGITCSVSRGAKGENRMSEKHTICRISGDAS